MRTRLVVVAAVLALRLPLSGQSADLIQNGGPATLPDHSFPQNKYEVENGALKFFLDPASTAVPGWIVTRNKIVLYDWENGQMPMASAHEFDLEGNGGLSQTITTVPGHHYRLTFRVSQRGRYEHQSVNVDIGKNQSKTFTPAPPPFAADGPMPQTFLFTASEPRTRIEFWTNCNEYGPWLSDVHAFEY